MTTRNSGAASTESVLLIITIALALGLATTWAGWRVRARWTQSGSRLDGTSPANDRTLKDESDAFRRLTGAAPATTDPLRPGKTLDGHEYEPNDTAWVPELETPNLPTAMPLPLLLGDRPIAMDQPPAKVHIPQDLSDLMDVVDKLADEHKQEIAFTFFIDATGNLRVRAYNYSDSKDHDFTVQELTDQMRETPAAFISPQAAHSQSAKLKSGEKGGTFHSHGSETDPAHKILDEKGDLVWCYERSPSPGDVMKAAEGDPVMIMQFHGQRYMLVQTDKTAAEVAQTKAKNRGKDLADLTVEAEKRFQNKVVAKQGRTAEEALAQKGYAQEAALDLAVHEMAQKLGLRVYRGTTGGELQLTVPR